MKKVNLPIFGVFLFVLTLGISSCSNDDNENNYDLNGRYIHLLENCDNSTNPEINCTEFIEFNESGIVNVLIGGDDIVLQTEYNINDSKVEFEKSIELSYDISFIIIDDLTLKRIEDGEIWTKDN